MLVLLCLLSMQNVCFGCFPNICKEMSHRNMEAKSMNMVS